MRAKVILNVLFCFILLQGIAQDTVKTKNTYTHAIGLNASFDLRG